MESSDRFFNKIIFKTNNIDIGTYLEICYDYDYFSIKSTSNSEYEYKNEFEF